MAALKKRKSTSGVSLLEVMVVLAIMALVIGIAAPRLLDSFGRAKTQAAQVELANIKGAIQLFYLDTGRYPTEAEGLEVLLSKPSNVESWRGPYVENADGLLDPWGKRYLYKFPGSEGNFDIYTYGRDGQPGGNNEDSDITL